MRPRRVAIYRCSFCQKEQWQVKRLIGGPGSIYICNECVDLFGEIIAEELAAPTAEPDVAHHDSTAWQTYADTAVQAALGPIIADMDAARTTIERLARENGTLLERIRSLEAKEECST